MENTGTVRHLRVFIGSPSDVKDERALLYAICARLQYEPALRSSAFIEIVAWDGPYTTVPLLAQLDPQSAVAKASQHHESAMLPSSSSGLGSALRYLRATGDPMASPTGPAPSGSTKTPRPAGVKMGLPTFFSTDAQTR